MKKLILLLIIFLITQLFHSVEINNDTFSLYGGKIEINITKEDIKIKNCELKQQSFEEILINKLDKTTIVGQPELPVKYFLFAKPENGKVFVNVSYFDPIVFENINIKPTQPPKPDCYDCPTKIVLPRYDQNMYPNTKFILHNDMIARKIGISQLGVFPYQYFPNEKKLIIFGKTVIRYSISGNFSIPINYKSNAILSSLQQLCVNGQYLNNSIFTTNFLRDNTTKGQYVIIYSSTVILNNQLTLLERWLMQKGFSVVTKSVDTISGDSETVSDSLISYLKNAYQTWLEPPEYVLLLGDVADFTGYQIIPTCYKTIHPADSLLIATDLYYACVDGDDILPDISVSRILADNSNDTERYLIALNNYEKTINENSNYYNTFTAAAYFQDENYDNMADRRFAQTAEEIATLFDDKFSKSVNRIYYAQVDSGVNPTLWRDSTDVPSYLRIENGFTWQYNTTEINNSISNGTFLLLHRDHGSTSGWGAPHYTYLDVQDLNFEGFSPIVLSLNCSTGLFDNENLDNFGNNDNLFFAENWMRSNKLTCGFIGSSRISFSYINDYFAEGLINFLTDFGWDNSYDSYGDDFAGFIPPDFNQPTGRLSDALNYAKLYLLEHYNIDDVKITFEEFNMLGETSFIVWKDIPNQFAITNISEINFLSQDFSFDANASDFTATLFDFSGNYYGKSTPSNTHCNIQIQNSLSGVDSLLLTVTKKGYLPYQDTIYVKQYLEISGTINGTLQNYTYFVTDNLTINSGEELIIPNGAVLKFATGKQMKVKGTLTVQGGDDISYFTSVNDDLHGAIILSSNSNPQSGDWDKIYFYNTYNQADTSNLQKLKILYATKSIHLFKSKVTLNNCDIGYCSEENIYSTGYSWAKSQLNLLNSYIRYGTIGSYIQNTDANIQNSFFDFNSQCAIKATHFTLSMQNTTIQYTEKPIIIAGNISINDFSDNTIKNCTYNKAIFLASTSGTIFSGTLPGHRLLADTLAYLTLSDISASDFTIEEGAVIKFGEGTSFTKASTGTIDFNGTPQHPIIFTSYRDDSQNQDTNGDGNSLAQKGDWNVCRIVNTDSDSINISNLILKYSSNGLRLESGNVLLQNSSFLHNSNYGIFCQNVNLTADNISASDNDINLDLINCDVTLQNSVFQNAEKSIYLNQTTFSLINCDVINNDYPIYVSGYFILNSESNNNFSSNSHNGIYYISSSLSKKIYSPASLGSLPNENIFPNGFSIAYNDSLRIEAGAVLKIVQDAININSNSYLIAEGTSDNPISISLFNESALTSSFNKQKLRSYWNGIKFYSDSQDTISVLKFINISDANVAIDINDRSFNIENCNISNCSQIGIKATDYDNDIKNCDFINIPVGIKLIDSNADISNNDFSSISDVAVYFDNTPIIFNSNTLASVHIPIRCSGYLEYPQMNMNQFSQVDFMVIELYGSVCGDIYNLNLNNLSAYFIQNSITIASDDILEIHNGTIIKMNQNAQVNVYGALNCLGTSSNYVIFTAFTDDEAGGDTNNDANATSPSATYWDKIKLNSAAASQFEYTRIKYATNAVALYSSNLTMQNTTIQNSNYGIYLNDSYPTIHNCIITENNYGIFVYNSDGAVICGSDSTHFNRIYNNSEYGVYNSSSGTSIDARYNWWGSMNGPTHSSNPNGDGDIVSNGVIYNPWKYGNGITTKPLSPQNVIIEISGNDVILSWDEVTNDENGNPTIIGSYSIFASDNPLTGFEQIGQTLTNSFTVPSGAINNKKFYKIVANSASKIRIK